MNIPENKQHPVLWPQLVLGSVADGGQAGADQTAVANLIKSWDPNFFLFGGDNNYENGAEDTMLANWAVYQTAIDEGKVHACLGNHDLEDNQLGEPQLNHLSAPGRYYKASLSPNLDVFILNSGIQTDGDMVEPDGNTENSDQAIWLRDQVAKSKAHWKLGIIHHPPYTSGSNYDPGIPVLRWDWKGIGLDALLSGHSHNYERLLGTDGFPYIIAGTGGRSLHGFGDAHELSQVRYGDDHGAMKITVRHDTVNFRFYNTSGIIQDDYTIAKGPYDGRRI